MRRPLTSLLGVLMILVTLQVVQGALPAAALASVQVVTGQGHTCALAPSGQAYCWGYNSNGQLGDNTTTDRSSPVAVQQGAVSFTSITAGGSHTCGLTSAGAVWCWGSNGNGRLGDNTTTDRYTPVAVQQGAVTFSSISAGGNNTCGLTSGGASYCWGYNSSGQLGDNSYVDRYTPVAVQQGAVTFSALITGAAHTCGLTSAGATYCWGLNSSGQLGDNTTTSRNTVAAVTQGGVSFSSISLGTAHTCGLTSAGATYCWGLNSSGQLGDNTTTNRLTPVATQQGAVVYASIATGASHTCGLTSGGTAYCWGLNANGEIGDTTTTNRLTPTAVSGGFSWTSIVSSETAVHTCGVKASTQYIYCWGERLNGRVGDNVGYSLQQVRPVAATGGLALTQLAVGSNHTCGLTSAGATWCWGSNAFGQLGDNTNIDRSSPVAVQQGAVTFSSITSGSAFTCGLTSGGQAYCWGYNGSGRLGDNTTTSRTAPVAVQQSGTVFSSISAGNSYACGLTSAGATWCWGYNNKGQLGDNTVIERHTPVSVQQSSVVYASIASGYAHTCGVTLAGATWCWGYNSNGQLGNNSTTDSSIPVAVQQSGIAYNSIALGSFQSCGVTLAGQAYCWGNNGSGRLGDNTTSDRHTPVTVQQGGITFASITVANLQTCGLTSGGAAYCWGNNSFGQVGDGTTTSRYTPVAVTGSLTLSAINTSEAANFGCGLSGTQAYCWGYDSYDQLGDWNSGDALTPSQSWYYVTSAGLNLTFAIDPALTLVVSGHTGTCDGISQSSGASATGTAMSLGHPSPIANGIAAQDIEVSTNAGNGYTVYLKYNGAASDGNGHTVADVSGSNASPVAFPSAGTAAFGYTTSETALGSGTANRFTNGGAHWAAFTTSAAEFSYSAGPVDHTVCLAVQTGVSPTTAAGSYTSTLTYTAVPSF